MDDPVGRTAAKFMPDVTDLRITLSVNDEPMMDASTSEMLYAVDEQLSIISEYMTLSPGDIVFTGSPAGSAAHHGGRWLKPETASTPRSATSPPSRCPCGTTDQLMRGGGRPVSTGRGCRR